MYSLGSNQVHTKTAGSGAEQEQLACVVTGSIVELVHLRATVLLRRRSVYSTDFPSFVLRRPVFLTVSILLFQEPYYDIQHRGEL